MQVVITGANRGIGLELARQMARRGDRVVGTARDPGRAEELAACGAEVEALEVTDGASARAIGERLAGRAIDVLVNNAGMGGAGPGLADLEIDRLRAYFDVNALGPLRVTQALLPCLRAGQRRLVVNLGTNLGSIGDNRSGGLYGYRASKAALNMLTRTLSLELAPDGFTCVVVHPGWVQTAMGGPRAPTPVADAVADLVRLLDRLDPSMTGRFWSHDGHELPW